MHPFWATRVRPLLVARAKAKGLLNAKNVGILARLKSGEARLPGMLKNQTDAAALSTDFMNTAANVRSEIVNSLGGAPYNLTNAEINKKLRGLGDKVGIGGAPASSVSASASSYLDPGLESLVGVLNQQTGFMQQQTSLLQTGFNVAAPQVNINQQIVGSPGMPTQIITQPERNI